MGLPAIQYLQPTNSSIFVIMYPWVCDNDTGTGDYRYFYGGPAYRPFGSSSLQSKCYYDNEPWDNDHDHGTTVPPEWQMYKFDFVGDEVVNGWMMAEKKFE